jgi:predicted metalloprotease
MSPGLVIGGGGGILALLVALFLGIDPAGLMKGGGQKSGGGPEEEKEAHFCKVIFKDTEEVWDEQFQKMGKSYEKPTLVLYRGQTNTGCGEADSGVGPFYCPADTRVYIDLSFFEILEEKLHSPGDFPRAYVIAHEVGHHVQKLLGYAAQADRIRRTQSKVEANHASVRLELQADYFAGVWAHHAQAKYKFLEKGDIEQATNAAFHIGDDYLQKEARGRVQPDAFTHGTSKQRQHWFMEGYKTGSVEGAKQLFSLRYEDL